MARYFRQIKIGGFTTILGVITMVGGIIHLFGVRGMGGAFLLILLSTFLVLQPWFDQHQILGKAEER